MTMSAAENEVLDPEVGAVEEVVEEEEQEGQQPTGAESEGGEVDDAGDEVVITLGEESPPSDEEREPAPQWVKDLRKDHRELQRKYRELEQQKAKPTETVVELGAKPKLEDCEYDTDRFERELEAWHARKRDVESKAEAKKRAENAAQAEFQATVASYEKAKAALKVSDFEGAEQALEAVFTPTQMALVKDSASSGDAAAQLVYALGSNPKEAKALASLIDKPVKFVAAVARLESKLKVTHRKAAPVPERTVRGNAPITGTDTQLERLRAEADRTGDRTKVAAYMRAQKAKGK